MGERAPLHAIEPARVAGGLGRRVLQDVRVMIDDSRPIVGYALVGLYADGTPFSASATKFGKRMKCNRHMFVGMATELIRDDLLTFETARDIVNRANGFDE